MKTPNHPPLCALIVGHSATDGGALSVDGTREYDFNRQLAMEIAAAVRPSVATVVLVYRTRGYAKLPGMVNETNADFAIEMHFNWGGGKASGSEVLYWHNSIEGRRLAWQLSEKLTGALGLPNRGFKPRNADGRGGYLLQQTRMPCVISEPFFGDNPTDWRMANQNRAALVDAYARAIEVQAAWIVGRRNGTISLSSPPDSYKPLFDS